MTTSIVSSIPTNSVKPLLPLRSFASTGDFDGSSSPSSIDAMRGLSLSPRGTSSSSSSNLIGGGALASSPSSPPPSTAQGGTPLKPVTCGYCSQRFATLVAQRQHMRIQHTCHVCRVEARVAFVDGRRLCSRCAVAELTMRPSSPAPLPQASNSATSLVASVLPSNATTTTTMSTTTTTSFSTQQQSTKDSKLSTSPSVSPRLVPRLSLGTVASSTV